jgi:hypothetical protein
VGSVKIIFNCTEKLAKGFEMAQVKKNVGNMGLSEFKEWYRSSGGTHWTPEELEVIHEICECNLDDKAFSVKGIDRCFRVYASFVDFEVGEMHRTPSKLLAMISKGYTLESFDEEAWEADGLLHSVLTSASGKVAVYVDGYNNPSPISYSDRDLRIRKALEGWDGESRINYDPDTDTSPVPVRPTNPVTLQREPGDDDDDDDDGDDVDGGNSGNGGNGGCDACDGDNGNGACDADDAGTDGGDAGGSVEAEDTGCKIPRADLMAVRRVWHIMTADFNDKADYLMPSAVEMVPDPDGTWKCADGSCRMGNTEYLHEEAWKHIASKLPEFGVDDEEFLGWLEGCIEGIANGEKGTEDHGNEEFAGKLQLLAHLPLVMNDCCEAEGKEYMKNGLEFCEDFFICAIGEGENALEAYKAHIDKIVGSVPQWIKNSCAGSIKHGIDAGEILETL